MNDAVIELKAQLEATEARKSELEFALAEAKVQARQGVAEQVLELIRASGFDEQEILELLGPKPIQNERKRARKERSAKQRPRLALRGDSSKTYARGPMPGWIKQAMIETGMQPENAEHRAAFKAQYMVPAE